VPSQYSFVTLQDAINALGARLYDPQNQQWTVPELTAYIREALRTWNALTGFWRADMSFPLTALQWWYDLRLQPNTLIPYTIFQQEIIEQVEYHLLEPPSKTFPLVWTGSNQFNINDLLYALQRRQDDTLGTTGCTLLQEFVNAPVGTRNLLPDTTIDIRRIAWLPTPGFGYSNTILFESDAWAKRAFDPFYTTGPQQPPGNWMQSTEPPPAFDVDRVPPVSGRYDVITVPSGPVWTTTTTSVLNIPDDWSWVIKWGALMDLLSRESNAKDEMRAEYCKRRYQEGLAFLEDAPSVLALRVNNIPMGVDALRDGDDFYATWQTDFPAQPSSAYTSANLMAFGPAPNGPLTWAQLNIPWGSAGSTTWASADAGPYSALVTVVQNAPVPFNLGDYIQVARDDFSSIIDYAQHLALFKSGGAEFAATIPLYQRFQRKAAQYNSKVKAMGFFDMEMEGLSQREETRNPRYANEEILKAQ
jgi:hypothetical protein